MNKQKNYNFRVKLHKIFITFKKNINHLIFPDDIKCIFCGSDISNFYDKPYCEDCAKTLPFNNGHVCKVCEMPIKESEEVCDFCKKEKKFFERAFCPFIYEGEVKNKILAFKDSNKRYLAKGFAVMIAKRILDANIHLDYITYIPMSEKGEKKRGFNQAKLLAQEIGKILNKPVLSYFSKDKDFGKQKFLTYKERQLAMVGMYSLKDANLKRTDDVLIVDDIITTTATVNYCAGLLFPKVNKVYVCAIARTIHDSIHEISISNQNILEKRLKKQKIKK